MSGPQDRRRVLILTASVGGGHDGPAREMARRLAERDEYCTVVDLVHAAPGGPLLCLVFRLLLLAGPARWGAMFARLDSGAALPWVARTLMAVAGRRIARRLTDERIDLVISTFPLGAAVAGVARARIDRSRQQLPIAAYITDPAVHRVWITPAVDLYLTTWTFGPAQVRTHTDVPVAVVAPAVRPQFQDRTAASVAAARLALRLPVPPVALVASGSWAVGDMTGVVKDLLAGSDCRPVVLCGRNHRLRRRLNRLPGVLALGWVQDMAAVMRACDVLVVNSGGLTVAEAAVVGLPVAHHRPLPGQGVRNAEICAAQTLPAADGRRRAPIDGAVDLSALVGRRDVLEIVLALGRSGPARPAELAGVA